MGLVTIQKNGKLHINRDLSKWRSSKVGKDHYVYYEEHPSSLERKNADLVKVELSRYFRELPLTVESVLARKEIARQEEACTPTNG